VLFNDARAHGVEIITAGQYLQPTRNHLPVTEYVTEEQFKRYEDIARQVGFEGVFVGPLVRSSYHAGEVFDAAL
jgi:lipoic acid synthetase